MNKVWSDEAWEDYLYWQSQDKKTLKRINLILQDIIHWGRFLKGSIGSFACLGESAGSALDRSSWLVSGLNI